MRSLAVRLVTFHWLATFALMGLFFVLFGAATYNLAMLMAANVRFLSMHGLMAVMEGALGQLAELVVTGYFGLAMYLGFKACERVLVEKFLGR